MTVYYQLKMGQNDFLQADIHSNYPDKLCKSVKNVEWNAQNGIMGEGILNFP